MRDEVIFCRSQKVVRLKNERFWFNVVLFGLFGFVLVGSVLVLEHHDLPCVTNMNETKLSLEKEVLVY